MLLQICNVPLSFQCFRDFFSLPLVFSTFIHAWNKGKFIPVNWCLYKSNLGYFQPLFSCCFFFLLAIIFLILFGLKMTVFSFRDSSYMDVQLLDTVPEVLFIFL